MRGTTDFPSPAGPRHGLARVLSKRGLASRTQAANWIREGRVRVNGIVVRDPEFPVRNDRDRIDIDGQAAAVAERVYLALNKPRGLVTSTADEQGRDTVYRCFEGSGLPWIAPVGRLDKASEGLLLFSNDPEWAARITDPTSGPQKRYHVQVDQVPDGALIAALVAGVRDGDDWLAASAVSLLRSGGKTAWLDIALDEGRNRQIRRLLSAFGIGVQRLVRVAIGGLVLGELAKGEWRPLTGEEVAQWSDLPISS